MTKTHKQNSSSQDPISQKLPKKIKMKQSPYPLLRLLPYMSRYKLMVILAIFSLLVAAFATLALPIGVRHILDNGVLTQNSSNVNGTFLSLLAIVSVLALGSALRFYCSYWLAERLVADLKADVFSKLITLDAPFYDQHHSGQIISHLAADTTLISTSIRSNVSQAIRNLVVFIGGLIMMMITSPSLSFMVICAIPLIVLPLIIYGRFVRRLSSQAQDVLADLNQYGSEVLQNIKTVQSFGGQSQAVENFLAGNEKTVASALKRTKARAILTAIAIFLVMASIVFILWYGATDVIAGNMSTGTLIQFMLYAVFAGGSMAGLSEVWGEVTQAAGATERLSSYLDCSAQIKDPDLPVQLPQPLRGEIVFNKVSFYYPGREEQQVLKQISFSIKAGEHIAIVGPSGAGKSTLFQLLQRFYDPQNGQISVDNIPIKQVLLHHLRESYALVPQDPSLFATTIQDNIAFAKPGVQMEEIVTASKLAQAHDFISEFPDGYQTMVGEGGQALSGGQKQRIALSRAMLRGAPILLLDEATSALDAQSEQKVQQALKTVMKNRTSLIIGHRLSTVINADRILVMSEGKIVEQGRHQTLMANNGLYAKLASTQLQAGQMKVQMT